MSIPQPGLLTPAKATECIRAKIEPHLSLHWTRHAKEQLLTRGLIMRDILHALKNGFVHEEGQPATRSGFFKYKMECVTPNSGGRTVVVVVIPSQADALKIVELKIVTVMWKDEDLYKD